MRTAISIPTAPCPPACPLPAGPRRCAHLVHRWWRPWPQGRGGSRTPSPSGAASA